MMIKKKYLKKLNNIFPKDTEFRFGKRYIILSKYIFLAIFCLCSIYGISLKIYTLHQIYIYAFDTVTQL